MSWIDIRIRKPKQADADDDGKVLQLLDDWTVDYYRWDDLESTIAWMRLPKFQRVDPPKGYRLIDTAKEPFRKDAIWWREGRKDWQPVRGDEYDEALLYCVPIDPPKPAYRPFRGGKEFEPFEDEWTIHIQQKVKFPPQPYSDNHWSGGTWEKAFELYTFADGRPFGMPVND